MCLYGKVRQRNNCDPIISYMNTLQEIPVKLNCTKNKNEKNKKELISNTSSNVEDL